MKGWRGDSDRHRLSALGIETGSKRRTPIYESDYRVASFINAPAEEPEAARVPGISAPLEEQQAQPVEGGLSKEPVSTVFSQEAPSETKTDEIEQIPGYNLAGEMIPGVPPPPKSLDEDAPGSPEA